MSPDENTPIARGEAPDADGDHSRRDEDTLLIIQMAHDAGYLAAVARFAPCHYPYVKQELERAHGFNPLVGG